MRAYGRVRRTGGRLRRAGHPDITDPTGGDTGQGDARAEGSRHRESDDREGRDTPGRVLGLHQRRLQPGGFPGGKTQEGLPDKEGRAVCRRRPYPAGGLGLLRQPLIREHRAQLHLRGVGKQGVPAGEDAELRGGKAPGTGAVPCLRLIHLRAPYRISPGPSSPPPPPPRRPLRRRTGGGPTRSR